MKLHHLALVTSQFKANYRFYTKILGLRLIKNTVNQDQPHHRQVYYGDSMGTPGSLITFHVSNRTISPESQVAFWSGLNFAIPRDSLIYWRDHLQNNGLKPEIDSAHVLHIQDPDNILITLKEVEGELDDCQINEHTSVPASKQILGLIGTSLFTANLTQTKSFFTDFLGIKVQNNWILLEDQQQLQLLDLSESNSKKNNLINVDHVAFKVKSQSELNHYWHLAKEKGQIRKKLTDRGYFMSATFLTPNKGLVELATESPGVALDESINNLGTTFALPPSLAMYRATLTQYYAQKGIYFDDIPNGHRSKLRRIRKQSNWFNS